MKSYIIIYHNCILIHVRKYNIREGPNNGAVQFRSFNFLRCGDHELIHHLSALNITHKR